MLQQDLLRLFTWCTIKTRVKGKQVIERMLNGDCRVFTVIKPDGDYYYKTLIATDKGYLLIDISAHVINEKTFIKKLAEIPMLHEITMDRLIDNWKFFKPYKHKRLANFLIKNYKAKQLNNLRL